MSDEPAPPLLEGSALLPKLRFLWSPRYRVPLCLFLFAGIIAAVPLLHPVSWFTGNSHTQDIATLKNQVANLENRLSHLEAIKKASPTSLIDPKQIKDIDARITALGEQVEAIHAQSKVDPSSERSERSLTVEKTFEKEVERLTEAQKTFKSILLFWRLKAKVLSEAPYEEELTDFKTTLNSESELKILGKYASQGLQALKQKDLPPPPANETNSWWDRLKAMATPFIKIERVDAPFFPLSRERQAVEEVLAQLEQTLAQQLTAMPGDAS